MTSCLSPSMMWFLKKIQPVPVLICRLTHTLVSCETTQNKTTLIAMPAELQTCHWITNSVLC